MLDTVYIFVFPLILMTLALVFNDTLFAFFGGVAGIFAGLYFVTDTFWAGMIFLGLGLYFTIAAIYFEAGGK